jgi:DNA-binding response OmpR family regulator
MDRGETVLIVDGDERSRAQIARALERAGYATLDVESAGEAIEAARANVALVLLELELPDMTGYEVCRELRDEHGEGLPIFFMSGTRTEALDRVAGLLLGADDFIVKPFELRALLARIRAVMRRVNDRSNSLMSSKEITLDPSTHVATFRGIQSTLSAREFSVMYALMERPGTILSRGQIESRIYGWGDEVQSNAVDVVIHGLRKRYGKDVIRNIRGAGWMVTKSGS